MTLPVFGFVGVPSRPLADGVRSEADWMLRAAETGRESAHL